MKKTHILRRTYSGMFGYAPACVPVRIAAVLNAAVFPYVTLYFSGLLTAALTGEAGGRIYLPAGAVVLSGFAQKGIAAVLERASGVIDAKLEFREARRLAEAEQTLPYESFASPGTKKKIQGLRSEKDFTGAGMPGLLRDTAGLVQHVLSLAVGFGVVLVLFGTRCTEAAPAAAFVDSGWTAALMVLLMAAVFGCSMFVMNRLGKGYFESATAFAKVDRVLNFYDRDYLERYKAGKDVRVFGQSGLIARSYDEAMRDTKPVVRRMTLIQGGLSGVMNTLTLVMSGVMALYVAVKARYGAVNIGMIVTYIGTVNAMCKSAQRCLFHIVNIRQAKPYFTYYWEIADEADAVAAGGRPVAGGTPEIVFDHVSYRYPGAETDAVHDVSFTLRGGMTAVVGRNGSGKSTLIALLCGLVRPTGGRILVNGTEIGEISETAYHEALGAVFQDFSLLSAPLAENLACSTEYDTARVGEVLKQVGWKKGADIALYRDCEENGVDLSGGEAQLAAMARALYRRPGLIVFDEPTAAMDPLTEAEVFDRMRVIAAQTPAVFVSHRLYACRFCGTILVMSGGGMVQQGSHEALLQEEEGEYAQLWNAQAQWYR